MSEARRIAVDLAEALDWDEALSGKLAIAVTEAATNLVKHAGAGEIHLQHCDRNGVAGVELISIDRGPGMADAEACSNDGFSTSGTAGTGLGAIRRLSTEFDIFSQPGKGTALVARFYPDSVYNPEGTSRLTVGAVRVAMRGESVSGDSWAVRTEQSKSILLVADGLGHGPGAAAASQEAVAVLERATELHPAALLGRVHRALQATRGAAVAIASIDLASNEVTFAGVGNINAMIVNGSRSQHLVSHNGTAGQAVRKIQDFTYPWPSRGLLLMHSDGLNTSWRLDNFPGLIGKHPSLISAVLYRDASRGRDDACVLAAREM